MRLLPVFLLAAAAFGQPDPSVLIEADLAFGRAAAERGAEGFVSFFAPDASILPAKSPVVTGIAALREVYRKIWATPGFSLSWKPLKAELARSGELGYTYGAYERKYREASGQVVTETGKYMTIWKKQPDGAWKAIVDMGN